MAEVQYFYDELCDDYEQLFDDWDRTSTQHARAVDGVLQAAGVPGTDVLDCAAGVGTQALGLAAIGYDVTASDLSSGAIARLRRNAARTGLLGVTAVIADFRDLQAAGLQRFSAVMALENSLPHLLEESDVRSAFASMAACLRPGGVLLVSTRDYDAERTTVNAPTRVLDNGARVVVQVWDWQEADVYLLRYLFITRSPQGIWDVLERTVPLRAWTRAQLSAVAEEVGLQDLRWIPPDRSGYHQQILCARMPRAADDGAGR
jgi:SAM-dependent methyltransferase